MTQTARKRSRTRVKVAARKSVRTSVKYNDEVSEALHRSAKALHRVGAMDTQTMRNFDVTCLARPVSWDKRRVRQLRQRFHMSQPVLAAYLNSTPSTIAQWESGAKRPSKIAGRLLQILAKHGPEILR